MTGAVVISADRLTIIGNGGNPIGQTEGWILRLPDCNANGQPDDCNVDHIPDDCEPFPPITEQPLDVEVEPGDAGYFMVTAEGDSLGYQRRHEGVELEDGEHIPGSDTSFLIIIDVVSGDAGQYDPLP